MNVELRKGKRTFGELEIGDVFEYYNHRIYIKTQKAVYTDEDDNEYNENAVDIMDGELDYCDSSEEVEYKGRFFEVEEGKNKGDQK